MPKHLLSSAALRALFAGAVKQGADTGKATKIGDGGGLMLVVRANGEASWILRFSYGGRRRDHTVGRWPVVGLKLARELAERALRDVHLGTDPLERHRAEQAALAASSDTVGKLFRQWLEKHELSEVYRGNIEAAFMKDVLPSLASTAPHLVSRQEIGLLLRSIEERGALVMARRVRMWLRQMFEFAVDDEGRPLVQASPVPTGTLRTFGRRKPRHFPAIVNAGEIGPLLNGIENTRSYVVRIALLFSVHVWQRPTEIREATWDEFHLDERKWIIPASRMKMQQEHWVPLSQQVVELLRSHQCVIGDHGYLFPGRRTRKPLSEGALLSRLIAMGYEHRHTPHGFRATARTILDEVLKVDTRFIERQLSHVLPDSMRGAYNRAEYWEGRVAMMQMWSDWLGEMKVAFNAPPRI